MIINNNDLLENIFSKLQKDEYIRLAWQTESVNFDWEGHNSITEFKTRVNELNNDESTVSIWFSPNGSNSAAGHTEANVGQSNWIFVDIDDVTYDEFIKDYHFLTPTFIIESGHGLQLYWRLKAPALFPDPKWKATEKAIVKLLSADPSKTNPAALLRVPNTANRKHLLPKNQEKGYLEETYCRVIACNDESYDIIDFESWGLELDEKGKVVTRKKPKRKVRKENNTNHIRKYCPAVDNAFVTIEMAKDSEAALKYPVMFAVANVIKNTIDDEGYLLELFSNNPGFNEDITLNQYRKMKNFSITCQQLMKWGWTSPDFSDTKLRCFFHPFKFSRS